jgi:membrane protein implicated in regulation of membrane protease activity
MSTPPDNKQDLSGPLSIVVLLLLLLAVIGVFLWWLLPTPKSVAAFGDAFGGVAGTLVSGFALVLLVFTVLQQQRALKLQREELSLQREELRDTREELKRTADAQEASGQVLREQVRIAQLVARLNAATALLGYYDYLASQIAPYSSGSIDTRQDVKAGREALFEDMNNLRDELRGAITATGFATATELTASGTGITTDPDA